MWHNVIIFIVSMVIGGIALNIIYAVTLLKKWSATIRLFAKLIDRVLPTDDLIFTATIMIACGVVGVIIY